MYEFSNVIYQPQHMIYKCKIILLNEWRCRDAPYDKQWKPRSLLSNTILAQSCVTPCLNKLYVGRGYT